MPARRQSSELAATREAISTTAARTELRSVISGISKRELEGAVGARLMW